MKKHVLAVLLAATMVAGCGDSNGPKVDILPQPYLVDPSVSPWPPAGPSSVGPTAPQLPLVESWEPPGGITRRWRYIIVHHSASDIGSLGKIDQWHRDKGWDGCGYDFVIGNGTFSADGLVQPSPRWKSQESGAHTRLSVAFAKQRGLSPNYYNDNGIGIVLVGNFDKSAPSAKQMASLARLVKYLMDRCQVPESRVVTHGGVDQTHCPGRYFSRSRLLMAVRALRAR